MIFDYLAEHWAEIGVAVYAAALAYVQLTPSPKDNEALAKAHAWILTAAKAVLGQGSGKDGKSQ